MKAICRADKDESGCNWLGGFFNDGVSPFWVTNDKASRFDDADTVAATITEKYGYSLIIEGTIDDRKSILIAMKNGTISKEDGIAQLKNLSK